MPAKRKPDSARYVPRVSRLDDIDHRDQQEPLKPTKCTGCNHLLTAHQRVVNGPDYCHVCNDSPCGARVTLPAAFTKPVPVTKRIATKPPRKPDGTRSKSYGKAKNKR